MTLATSNSEVPILEMRGLALPRLTSGLLATPGMDWSVRAGEFWVVGGLLGSGKTDLLSTAAGLLPPSEGELQLLGRSVKSLTADDRLSLQLRVGLVHDGGRLLRHLSVAENIALPLRYHHNATLADVSRRVEAWIEATQLQAVATQASGRISRNWATRAGLARACVLEPEILLVDNPLSGLDPQHVHWWLDCLQQISEGHPLLGYRRRTLIVTCDDFQPWFRAGRRFGVLTSSGFRVMDRPDSADQLEAALMETKGEKRN